MKKSKHMNNKENIYGSKWILLIMLLFLVSTHILFKIPAPLPWLEAVWGAGDLLSLVGTVFLGDIALQQNEKSNKLNYDLQEQLYVKDSYSYPVFNNEISFELDTDGIKNTFDNRVFNATPWLEQDGLQDNDECCLFGFNFYLVDNKSPTKALQNKKCNNFGLQTWR